MLLSIFGCSTPLSSAVGGSNQETATLWPEACPSLCYSTGTSLLPGFEPAYTQRSRKGGLFPLYDRKREILESALCALDYLYVTNNLHICYVILFLFVCYVFKSRQKLSGL